MNHETNASDAEFWLEHDRLSVSMASKAAAVGGAPTTWIADETGSTLPRELASVGYHIMVPHDGLPDWLESRISA